MNWLRKPSVRKAILGAIGTGLTMSVLSRGIGKNVEASMRSPLNANSGVNGGFQLDHKAVAMKRAGLKFKTREEHLKEVESTPEYDVVVIGGGCVGAGVALNTSAIGMKTLVIDAYDFGSGTSSKSTKLLHGGYRYFQQIFEFNLKIDSKKENYELVKESVEERDIVINNVPYANRYIALCVPTRNIIGLWMYHKLSMRFLPATSEFGCPGPRIISQDEVRRNFPYLDTKYKWGVVVYDGEMDDTRLLMEAFLTASQDGYIPGMKGANMVNYARLDKFVKDSTGKITGVEVYDKVNKKTFVVKSKHVVNATGNFTDVVRRMDDPSIGYRIVHALGTHVMLDRSFCSRDMGILIPKTSDGRVLFCVPWLQGTTVGTTDVILPDPSIHPTPSASCVEFLAHEAKELFPIFRDQPFESCIKSKWAGTRPLVLKHDQELRDTAQSLSGKDISRSHAIIEAPSGLVSAVGGKWTTFRRMGEEVMTLLLQRDEPGLTAIPSEKSTRNMRFIGDYRSGVAGKPLAIKGVKQHQQYVETLVRELDIKYGSLGLPLLSHLARCYGIRSLDILEMIAKEPKLGERLHPNFETTQAEIVYQIRSEMVVNVFDLLLRRNRLAFLDRKAAEDVMPMTVELLGSELGWSDDQKRRNLAEALEIYQKMEF